LGNYAYPRISPDGRQIALNLLTDNAGLFPNPDIWRFDIGSKVLDRITTDSNSTIPLWIDGGQRIAYARMKSGTDTVVMARPLYKRGVEQVLCIHKKSHRDVSVRRAGGQYITLHTR